MVHPLDFNNLPRFLNFMKDKQNVVFCENHQRIEMRAVAKETDLETRITTWQLFSSLLIGHAPETLIAEIRELSNCGDLTAGKIREIYRYCQLSSLDAYQRAAAMHPLYKNIAIVLVDGVPVQKDNPTEEECQKTLKHYKAELIAEFGAAKFSRVCERYGINFNRLDLLTVDHIHQLMIGMNDINMQDVESLKNKIEKIISSKSSLKELPHREYRGLLRAFNASDDESLIRKLSELFAGPGDQVDLSADQFDMLMEALVNKNEEAIFSGHKIEGPINSSKAYYSHALFYCRWFDDQERLQLYRDIQDLPKRVPEDQIELAYDEIFAKALVKKEMEEGMLIPAPPVKGDDGKTFKTHWYRVEKRVIPGKGKFFYHLVPATTNYDAKMKERIEFRSTSSSPSMLDAFSTVIADISPHPAPGYYCKEEGVQKEIAILRASKRPIKINGHSLGGTLTQLLMINLMEATAKDRDSFPQREIELHFFDAPAISADDCKRFAEWVLENPALANRIHLSAHFSREDFISGMGERHLGYGVRKDLLGGCSFALLEATKEGKWIPELVVKPHTQEFFITEKNVDFTETPITIEAFDEEAWRVKWEKGRRRVGYIATPLLRGAAFLRDLFVGTRLRKPRMFRYFKATEPLVTALGNGLEGTLSTMSVIKL